MRTRDLLLKNIQFHMERRGVATMTELARKSGVKQSTLSRFETGLHESISLPAIDAVARALQIDVAQLFLPTGDDIQVHQAQAFAGVMEQLTPPERDVLLATGHALVESRRKTS